MFGLFKKKSQVYKLHDSYEKLMQDSHRLSTTNRKLSDSKFAEAQEVLEDIDALRRINKTYSSSSLLTMPGTSSATKSINIS